jgi:septal ring factor EnvC (AmiA/AmiB activator)
MARMSAPAQRVRHCKERMMKKALLLVLVHVVCASGVAVLAQEEHTGGVNEEIVQQLVAANQSFDELVKLVKHLVEQQEGDVLVRRLEIEERAALALQPELNRVRDKRDEAEQNLASMRRSVDLTDNPDLVERLEDGIPGAKARLAQIERSLQELELDLEERRKAIERLKSRLDEGQ